MSRRSIRTRETVAGLVAVLLVAVAAPGAQAASAWLAPVAIDGPRSAPAYTLNVGSAMNDDGAGVIAFERVDDKGDANDANDTIQVLASYKAAGGGYGAPQPLGPERPATYFPLVDVGIANDGRAIVAFTDRTAPDVQLRTASSGPDGTFAASQAVGGQIANEENQSVHMAVNDSGAVAIVWNAGINTALQGATGTIGGAITKLASPVSALSWVGTVAIDPAGNAVFAWERDVPTARYIIEVRDKPAGAAMKPIVTLTEDTIDSYQAEGPSVDVGPDGRAIVAYGYRDPIQTTEQIRYNTRTAPTGNWAAGHWDVEDNGGNPNQPGKVASEAGQTTASYGTIVGLLPDNQAVITYVASDNAVWTAYRLSGQQFAGHQALSEGAGGSYSQRMALSKDGTAVVSFVAATAMQAAVRAPGQSQFGATKEDVDIIRPAGYDNAISAGPVVAIDGHGNATMAYTIARCTTGCPTWQISTRAALLDSEGPRLGTVSAPTSGVAGAGLDFSASSLDVFSAITTTWSFGDGATATGPSVSHAYAAAGSYTVTVTATDAVGHASSTSRTVNIAPKPAQSPGGGGGGGGAGGAVVKPTPALSTAIGASIKAYKTYSKIKYLRLARVPANATVTMTCLKGTKKGKGCPFKLKTVKYTKARSSADLTGYFNVKKKLRGSKKTRRVVARIAAGTKIVVVVAAPGSIGRSLTLTIRGGKSPLKAAGCTAPGRVAAVSCPT